MSSDSKRVCSKWRLHFWIVEMYNFTIILYHIYLENKCIKSTLTNKPRYLFISYNNNDYGCTVHRTRNSFSSRTQGFPTELKKPLVLLQHFFTQHIPFMMNRAKSLQATSDGVGKLLSSILAETFYQNIWSAVSGEVLAWLSVWTKVQMIYPADATATSSSLAPVNSRMVYLSGAGLPRLSWKKR